MQRCWQPNCPERWVLTLATSPSHPSHLHPQNALLVFIWEDILSNYKHFYCKWNFCPMSALLMYFLQTSILLQAQVVVKCRFYYCMGMARPTDKKGCHWKDSLWLTDPPKKGGTAHRASGPVRRQRGTRELWARAFMVISTRRGQQGRVRRFRIGQLNNFSGLWGTEAVPCCLVPGPGGWFGQADSGPVCESPIGRLRVCGFWVGRFA